MLHRALNGEVEIRIVETFDVEQVEMEVGTSVGGTDAEEDITKYL
jgi:homoserine acetyltransferase